MIPRNSNVATAALIVAAALVLLGARAASAAPSPVHAQAAAKKKRLPAPRQTRPAAGEQVQVVPAFGWKPVRRAVRYEFQLAADSTFRSIVLGPRKGTYQTPNTYASINKTLADGDYYWRVRAIDKRDHVGRWSKVRSIRKAWTDAPRLVGPVDGAPVDYPNTPLVLRWEPVPNAARYVVRIATDEKLAHSVLGDRVRDVDTSGSAFAFPGALAQGTYFWAVTPLDAEKHSGERSEEVGRFEWRWPSTTTARVTDLNTDPRVYDPQFSWDPVPGAASYEIEVNPSADFAAGSRVCCDDQVVGTTLSPRRLLPNNDYFWHVRAIDVDGNAGAWTLGPRFHKGFDDVVPTVPKLRMRDNVADKAPAKGATGLPTTDTPVVAWDPVPGASSYQVVVAPWDGFCNWTANEFHKPRARSITTATTAWAPLGFTTVNPTGLRNPPVSGDGWLLWDGVSYCVRVRARTDRDATGREIVSDWTQLGGLGNPAFTYDSYKPQQCTATSMPEGAYNGPATGISPRMPLFTWDRVPGACGYFVVVARDRAFTKVVDVAFTNNPAYAPFASTRVTTYADEMTSYYWAVMPTAASNGVGLSTQPQEDFPQAFDKRSVAPRLLSPAPRGDVAQQPAFRWSAAEGARQYRIQVGTDPTFGDPLIDVVTNATAYTSTIGLPPDTDLYWRVRADDENKIGLTWSETRSFRRRLPVPVAAPDNPLGGETIPVLRWAPQEGAVSYDMHVEQANGTVRNFTMRSTAFTPVTFFGTGVWHWQARANFKAGSRVVSGGYFPFVPFARRIATPAGLRTSKAGGGILLSWQPTTMAAEYKVEISTSDSFSTVVESVVTDNTSFAPKMLRPAFSSGEPLYWRVATLDEGHNAGGWAASPLRAAKRMRLRLKGALRAGRSTLVRGRVTSGTGRRVKGVRVALSGAGLTGRSKRTDRRGIVRFRLRPRARGVVRFTADKRGFAPAAGKLKVR